MHSPLRMSARLMLLGPRSAALCVSLVRLRQRARSPTRSDTKHQRCVSPR